MNSDACHALDAWLCAAADILAEVDGSLPAAPVGAGEPELVGKLWVRLHKERDLELHVRVGWLAGTEFIQLVDFVPSIGRYETGVMLEGRLLDRLLDELRTLHRYGGLR